MMAEQSLQAQIEELTEEIKFLRKRNLSLSEENGRLKSLVQHLEDELHSSRAGRKKHNERWQSRKIQIEEMARQGKKPAEICRALKISRNTYYRYKRAIREVE